MIGILSAGSPVEMPWLKNCEALLHSYLCGEAGAGAILDILTGKINPSGRLTETYPIVYEDTPACAYYPGMNKMQNTEKACMSDIGIIPHAEYRFAFPLDTV